MAPFVGPSGTVMNLDPLISAGLVRNGTIVEIKEGLSSEEVAEIVAERFEKKPATVTQTAPIVPVPASDAEPPRGNASRDEWVAYAITQGKTEDDLAGLKQGEIRALVNTEEADAKAKAEAEADAKAKAEAEAAAEAHAKAEAEAEAAEELAAQGNADND